MIRWELIEPTDGGPFDWSPIESHVAEAIRNGLEVIGTFQTFPSWAGLDTAVPSDPADPFFSSYYSFIFSVATQFAGRIRYYSPLNEPVQAQTPYPALNIEIYKRLLQECHDAVVAADAEAMIFGPETYQQLTYYTTVLQDCCQYLDVVAVHFYPDWPGGSATSATTMSGWIEQDYIPVLQAYCPGKPFWVTEFGVRSTVVGEDVQSDVVTEAYRETLERSYIDRMYLYRIEDNFDGVITYGMLRNFEETVPQPADPFPPKPSYWAIKDLIEEVRTSRVVTVDATAPDYLELEHGTGAVSYSPTDGSAVSAADLSGDCRWTPVNDYRGIAGLNVFVSHPGPNDLPTCGANCATPGQDYENSPWLGIHISGLQNGAPYRVSLRFLTIPNHPDTRGVRAYIPGSLPWVVVDQNSPAHTIVRELHDGTYDWEEWQVYIGDARVSDGEIEVIVDDALDDGSCVLREANISGVVLETALYISPVIFYDDFESGDADAWSEIGTDPNPDPKNGRSDT